MNTHMRLLVRVKGDKDDPGNEVIQLSDIKVVPREYDIIQHAGNKYIVVEGGILWSLTEQGVYVTVVAETYTPELVEVVED